MFNGWMLLLGLFLYIISASFASFGLSKSNTSSAPVSLPYWKYNGYNSVLRPWLNSTYYNYTQRLYHHLTDKIGCNAKCQSVSFNCSGPIQYDYSTKEPCSSGDCVWLISSDDPGQRIVLNFAYYETNRDLVLTIYDGDSLTSPVLATFSGPDNYVVIPLRSSGPTLTLHFSSSNAASNFYGNCTNEPIPSPTDPASSSCQTRYFYASSNGTISSGDFQKPWTQCTYLIRLPKELNKNVQLKFNQLNMPSREDEIEVRETIGIIGKYSGTSEIADVASTSNFMNITIKRYSEDDAFDFRLKYFAAYNPCACSTATDVSWSGRLFLPYYPRQQYCNNMSCTYRITVQSACLVRLIFDEFVLARGDSLSMYSGSVVESDAFLKRLTSTSKLPSNIKSNINVMTLVFTTDNNYVSTGFYLRYEAACGLSTTNIIGLAIGMLVFVLLFGGSVCFCCQRFRSQRRLANVHHVRRRANAENINGRCRAIRERRGAIDSNSGVFVTATGSDDQTILALSIIASAPPAYDQALAYPLFRRPGRQEPPPPDYETVIKDDNDAQQRSRTNGNNDNTQQQDVRLGSTSGSNRVHRNSL